MKALVVAAHPDDEVFGCGGTIAVHTQRGDDVFIIVLADGVTSRFYRPDISRKLEILRYKKSIEMRKKEFISAVLALGVKKENCVCFDLDDQRLDGIPLLDIVKRIEETAQDILPDVVYTHHWADINKDHRICSEAVLTVFRPTSKIFNACKLLCFEIPGNMDLLPPNNMNRFVPDHFVDISTCIESKIAAAKAYNSELCEYPHPLSLEMIIELSQMRARHKGYKYAEAFERLK